MMMMMMMMIIIIIIINGHCLDNNGELDNRPLLGSWSHAASGFLEHRGETSSRELLNTLQSRGPIVASTLFKMSMHY